MASPVLELQGAIVTALKADAAVAAIVGARVYDHVPRSATSGEITADYPLLGLGSMEEITDDAECIAGSEVFVSVDAWSRSVGRPEALKLAHAVKLALHNAELTLTENALVELFHLTTRTLRDSDGLTTHAVIEFRAITETPD
jgi:hypothetical protein